jgi:sarcosine oxidase
VTNHKVKINFDTIVLGLGGMGSSAAYHLAARGAKVLGLDQYGAVHDRGSSHGGSRMIRQAYHEDTHYVPLVLRAYELWRQLEQDTRTSLLRITGGIYLGTAACDAVRGSLLSATMHDLPIEILTAREVRNRFPALRPDASESAVYEANAGFVRPERAVAACLQGATRNGADLHFNEPVSVWEVTAEGMARVTTPRAVYTAAKLILTPGAWASETFSGFDLPLVVRRHVMAWYDPIGGIGSFLPERFPVYLWQTSPDCIFYGFPAIDGQRGGVKVAMHTGGDLCTPKSISRIITHQDERELRDQIASRLPSLNGRLLAASTCMYTLTPDEQFVVGLHPNHPEVAIGCGFSGHGFKFASVIGEILADLAMEGKTRHSIEFLSPNRFRRRASFT